MFDDTELVTRTKYRYNQLCAKRDGWKNIFRLLSKYILLKPIYFGDTSSPQATPYMSVRDVSDDEAIDQARTAATALGGALWPNISQSFEIVPTEQFTTSDFLYQTQEVESYAEEVTRRLRAAIDAPDARFMVAWAEYLDGQVVMGTSGIYAEENEYDEETPFYFCSVGVETAVIDENSKGQVDTVHFEYTYTPRQLVERYGIDNVSQKARDAYKEDKANVYIKVVQAVQPREKGKVGASKKQKPYASIHFEVDTNHLLKEDGMDARSVWVTRFRKWPGELYGRGLGGDALPSIKELNILRHAYTQALMLILKPPYGFYHDQIGGAGQFDMSPGARVPLYNTGRVPQGQMPIMPLLQITEPQAATQRIETLTAKIGSKFLVDKLLDFNNETRMTLGEANMRQALRNQGLSNIFARQITELLHPLVKWCFDTMLRRKLLGLHPVKDAERIYMMKAFGMEPLIIPQAIANLMDQGKNPLTIRFNSPAARTMKADSMQGLQELTNYVLAWENAGVTNVKDVVDVDQAVREYQQLSGAPRVIIRAVDAVKKLRAANEAAARQMQNVQMAEIQAKTGKDVAKTARDFTQAGLPPQAAFQMQQGAQAA